jgi:hypothetical protein
MLAVDGVVEIHEWKLGDIRKLSPGVSVVGILRTSDLLKADAEMGKRLGIYQLLLQGD